MIANSNSKLEKEAQESSQVSGNKREEIKALNEQIELIY